MESKTPSKLMTALIVVAFLSITAALFIPVYSPDMGPPPALTCLSNVKQLTVGMLLYADDYDDRALGFEWEALLFPYVKKREVFQCPTLKEGGYALNAFLANNIVPEDGAETVAFLESPASGRNALLAQVMPIPLERHKGRLTISFADGHAKNFEYRDATNLGMLVARKPSSEPPKGSHGQAAH